MTNEALSQDTKMRGIRQTMPTGYLLGRKSAGNGPVELLTAADVSGLGGSTTIIGGGGTYVPDFTGGIPVSINRRLSREVWMDDLSSPLTTTDWGPVITAKLAAALPHGGICFLSPNQNYDILTSCTIPAGVTIRGQYSGIGTVADNSEDADFSTRSAVRIKSTKTVSLKASAGFEGCLIYRQAMTFLPTSSAGFAGTAITGIGDDCFIKDCMILGFAQAFTSTNVNRVHCTAVHFDNQANILIYGSLDTCYISGCHAWPYLTHTTGDTAARNKRTGTNIGFDTCNDWSKVTDCFSYGYAFGFVSNNSDSINFIGCGADNVSVDGFGIGFQISGGTGAADNKMIGCQAAANTSGFAFTHTSGNTQWMESCTAWGNTQHGVLVNTGCTGGVTIHGGMCRDNGSDGIAVASATAAVMIDFVAFNDQATPITVAVDTFQTWVGPNCSYGNMTYGTPATGVHSVSQSLTIFSAAVPLNPTGNCFAVSGDFADVVGGYKDRMVTFLFTGTSTVTSTSSATATKVYLAGNTTTTFSAGDTLTIRHLGSGQWYEQSRSAAAGSAAPGPKFNTTKFVASATTIQLANQGSNDVSINGTTTITSFGTTGADTANGLFRIYFGGALQITASSHLLTPNGVNINTQAGDVGWARYIGPNGTDAWYIEEFVPISGQPAIAVDLASHVSGNLAVSHLNSGTGAAAGTVWAGDGTWKVAPLAAIADLNLLGNVSGGSAAPIALTGVDVAKILNQQVSHTARGGMTIQTNGGLMYVQWGTVTVTTSGTPVSESYYVTFPSGPVSTLLTPLTGAGGVFPVGTVVAQGASSFTADSSISGKTFMYIAIGW